MQTTPCRYFFEAGRAWNYCIVQTDEKINSKENNCWVSCAHIDFVTFISAIFTILRKKIVQCLFYNSSWSVKRNCVSKFNIDLHASFHLCANDLFNHWYTMMYILKFFFDGLYFLISFYIYLRDISGNSKIKYKIHILLKWVCAYNILDW